MIKKKESKEMRKLKRSMHTIAMRLNIYGKIKLMASVMRVPARRLLEEGMVYVFEKYKDKAFRR